MPTFSASNGDDQRVAHRIAAAINKRIEIAVIGNLRAAEQRGVFLQPQGDVAFDLDRAGEIAAFRKLNRSAAVRAAIINCFLNGDCVDRYTIADHACFCCVNKFAGSGHHNRRRQNENWDWQQFEN